MEAQPISKVIYEKAKELGINTIELRFSGGNDEGYLDIEVKPWDKQGEMDSEIEEWAWQVYQYNGAGDGNDYGDNITYDLEKGQVTTCEWYMARQDNENDPEDLQIAK